MEKVIRDGKVAILYSPGYGAGWYSWSGHKELLFNPVLVDMVEKGNHKLITDKFVKKLLNIDIYTGGADDLKIGWLDVGTAFIIDEYDGFESLKAVGGIDFLIA